MGDDWYVSPHGHRSCYGFRIGNPVEDDQCPRIEFVEQLIKSASQAVSGCNVVGVEQAGGRIIPQMVTPQGPANCGQTKRPQRHPSFIPSLEISQRSLLEAPTHSEDRI